MKNNPIRKENTRMINKLKFPIEYQTHKYSLIHFSFFIQYARIAGIEVELVKSTDTVFISNDHLIFSCLVNDRQIVVDYADHYTKNWQKEYPDIPYFKFQTNLPLPENCIPLGPPMVGVKKKGSKGATMREYMTARYHYNYQPEKNILCKQAPNGAAVERRLLVHKILADNFKDIDISYDNDQLDFWAVHENCLAAVCVPGATNNMIDRGHMELIGLGVCTISPKLYTVFPQNIQLEEGIHYIRCKDDYSDLVDIIQSLQKNLEIPKTIGRNARNFYDETYSPKKYWEWILENLK
jgi:hypothetical protein